MIRSTMINLLILVTISIDRSCAFTSILSNQQLFTRVGPATVPRKRESTRYYSSRMKYSYSYINLWERETAHDIDHNNDGWGDDETDLVETNSTSLLRRKSERSRELTMLQEDLANRREGRRSKDSTTTVKGVGEEKDLFIPTVTLVAIIGFTGLYGYEMLRLYARGELYLPWDR